MQMSQTIGFSIADTKKLTVLFFPLVILNLVGMFEIDCIDVFFNNHRQKLSKSVFT